MTQMMMSLGTAPRSSSSPGASCLVLCLHPFLRVVVFVVGVLVALPGKQAAHGLDEIEEHLLEAEKAIERGPRFSSGIIQRHQTFRHHLRLLGAQQEGAAEDSVGGEVPGSSTPSESSAVQTEVTPSEALESTAKAAEAGTKTIKVGTEEAAQNAAAAAEEGTREAAETAAAFTRASLRAFGEPPKRRENRTSHMMAIPPDERPKDLSCLRRTGLSCSFSNVGIHIQDSDICMGSAKGPSTCLGNQCWCDEGHCADMDGHCMPEQSLVMAETFTITTGAFPNSPLKMVFDADGTNGRVVHDPFAKGKKEALWKVIARPDGGHLLTTVAHPHHALGFYEECKANLYGGTTCLTQVGAISDPTGSEVKTVLEVWSGEPDDPGRYLVFRDVGTNHMLYFDTKVAQNAMGCDPAGKGCPGPAGLLVFDPPIPPNLELHDTARYSLVRIGLQIMLGLALIIVLCLCANEYVMIQKNTRF